jgi:predicted short-subunit dehydrogenase-like oxidoreductase (DUF2520 family)
MRARPKIAIIGPGVVGRSIGRLLHERRFPIAAVAGPSAAHVRDALEFIGAGRAARSPAVAAHSGDVVFLTVPDRMIRPVCEEIAAAKGFRTGAVVIHCSGVYDASILAAARERKTLIAALHPLQSFASPEVAVKAMKGTCFTFDGDEEAAPVAGRIVEALGGRMLRLRPGNRALYHAASCVLSNYLVAVADLGMIMLVLSGMEKGEAARAARPLLAGTVENIGRVGVPAALTGPISRGDVETVARHLAALGRLPREIRRLYCSLGLYTVRVAQRKGTLNQADARSLVRLLTEAGG